MKETKETSHDSHGDTTRPRIYCAKCGLVFYLGFLDGLPLPRGQAIRVAMQRFEIDVALRLFREKHAEMGCTARSIEYAHGTPIQGTVTGISEKKG